MVRRDELRDQQHTSNGEWAHELSGWASSTVDCFAAMAPGIMVTPVSKR